MRKFKFVEAQPEDGTSTLGVVYHLTRENEISLELGIKPIGWVVEEEPHREEGQLELFIAVESNGPIP